MSDDLDDLVNDLSAQAPPPQFLTDLRERLVAEAELLDASERARGLPTAPHLEGRNDVSLIDLELQSEERVDTTATVRFVAVAAVAALALFVSVWFAGSSNDTATLETATELAANPADPQTPLVPRNASEVQPGRYRVDVLGTEFEFEVDEPTQVIRNADGVFQLGDPSADGGEGRLITFARVSAFANPDNPFVPITDGDDLWPADDLFGWIDALSEQLSVTVIGSHEVGDALALRFLILGDAERCEINEECAYLLTNNLVNSLSVPTGGAFGVWYFDQGDEDPIVAVFSSDASVHRQWFSSADQLMATVEFSEIEPNPIPDS